MNKMKDGSFRSRWVYIYIKKSYNKLPLLKPERGVLCYKKAMMACVSSYLV